jgi:hypothetical protein
VAPQEEPQASLSLDSVLIWTRDVDQLLNIVRLVEEDRPGIEELSQAVRSAPPEAVSKAGLEVVGECVFEHLLRRHVALQQVEVSLDRVNHNRLEGCGLTHQNHLSTAVFGRSVVPCQRGRQHVARRTDPAGRRAPIRRAS